MRTLKDRILEELQKNGPRVSTELAKSLNAPYTTVWHNLLQLAIEGKIKRIKLSTRVILWEAVKGAPE